MNPKHTATPTNQPCPTPSADIYPEKCDPQTDPANVQPERSNPADKDQKQVDDESAQSFPASDPPSYNTSTI